ncbi:MAG: hypothetical protein ABI182_04075 [Candidatus Baltobacteraceae bacterium]
MSPLLLSLIVVFIIGAAIGIYALAAPRRAHGVDQAPRIEMPTRPFEDILADPVADADREWSSRAGSEFAGLSETARCELIFAIAALDDRPSHLLLVTALDDPSEAVALAAAHALANAGEMAQVRVHAAAHPGPRTDRVIETLALLEP